MTDLEKQAHDLQAKVATATLSERMVLQPQMDRIVTNLTARGLPVSKSLQRINNTLKDEALDDMFDNMPI